MSEAHKIVCHAPGDTCLGCGHYRGELSDCEHKQGQIGSEYEKMAERLDAWAAIVHENYPEIGALPEDAAALIHRLAAENAALAAEVEECNKAHEQTSMLLGAKLREISELKLLRDVQEFRIRMLSE